MDEPFANPAVGPSEVETAHAAGVAVVINAELGRSAAALLEVHGSLLG